MPLRHLPDDDDGVIYHNAGDYFSSCHRCHQRSTAVDTSVWRINTEHHSDRHLCSAGVVRQKRNPGKLRTVQILRNLSLFCVCFLCCCFFCCWLFVVFFCCFFPSILNLHLPLNTRNPPPKKKKHKKTPTPQKKHTTTTTTKTKLKKQITTTNKQKQTNSHHKQSNAAMFIEICTTRIPSISLGKYIKHLSISV